MLATDGHCRYLACLSKGKSLWPSMSRYHAIAGGPERGDRADRALLSEGIAVYVACSTLCFGRLPLDEALRTIRDMRFAKVDLALRAEGPHLRPEEVLADVSRMAQRLKSANVQFAAFDLAFDTYDGVEVRNQLRAVCRLARLLAVPVLSVPAAAVGADPNVEVARLTDWQKVAEGDGLILTVSTHTDTMTGDANCAAELCHRVPGLGLTLDPSYYLCGPHAPVNFDHLYPFVRHTRLRDSGTKPEEFQVRVGQGQIDYARVIGCLQLQGYDRTLSVDVRDIPDSTFPVDPEVRKLKYLLESLI